MQAWAGLALLAWCAPLPPPLVFEVEPSFSVPLPLPKSGEEGLYEPTLAESSPLQSCRRHDWKETILVQCAYTCTYTHVMDVAL